MKKQLANFVAMGLFLIVSTGMQTGSKEYTIQGKIRGNVDGKSVYLKRDDKTIVDSTIIKNGSFYFKGNVNYPSLHTITILKNDNPATSGKPLSQPIIPVFLENSAVKISGMIDSISVESEFYYTNDKYKYENINVKGSLSHDSYLRFINSFNAISKERMEIHFNR